MLFRPARAFHWIIGEAVLRLNDALYGFRRQAADHLLFLDRDKLQAYYGELDGCVESLRDKLVVLTEYCNKGFEGKLDEALEGMEKASAEDFREAGTAEGALPAVSAAPEDGDVFEAYRQRHVEAGILTELGQQEGWVALRPCPFFGRLMGEMVCTFNDALTRVEGRMAADIMMGKEDALRQYFRELQRGVAALREDLKGITALCGGKVA